MGQAVAISAALLKAVACGAGTEETRYYLKGVKIEFSAYGTTLVATNGQHMIVGFQPNAEGDSTSGPDTIIPLELINQIKLAKKAPEFVIVRIDGLNVELDHWKVVNKATAIEGTYPNWRAVVPKGAASGELAHYDFNKVAPFAKAQKIMGIEMPARINYNGDNPAIVDMFNPNLFGVIIGLRDGPDMKHAPQWARL